MTEQEANLLKDSYEYLFGKDIKHRNPLQLLKLTSLLVKNTNAGYKVLFGFDRKFISDYSGHLSKQDFCDHIYFEKNFIFPKP